MTHANSTHFKLGTFAGKGRKGNPSLRMKPPQRKLGEVTNTDVRITVGAVPMKGLPHWPTKFRYLIWVEGRGTEVLPYYYSLSYAFV